MHATLEDARQMVLGIATAERRAGLTRMGSDTLISISRLEQKITHAKALLARDIAKAGG
jgi:hypothetical protein